MCSTIGCTITIHSTNTQNTPNVKVTIIIAAAEKIDEKQTEQFPSILHILTCTPLVRVSLNVWGLSLAIHSCRDFHISMSHNFKNVSIVHFMCSFLWRSKKQNTFHRNIAETHLCEGEQNSWGSESKGKPLLPQRWWGASCCKIVGISKIKRTFIMCNRIWLRSPECGKMLWNIKNNPLGNQGRVNLGECCLSKFKNALWKVGQWDMCESTDHLVLCRPIYSIKRISVASLTCYVQLHQLMLEIKMNRCGLLSNVT